MLRRTFVFRPGGGCFVVRELICGRGGSGYRCHLPRQYRQGSRSDTEKNVSLTWRVESGGGEGVAVRRVDRLLDLLLRTDLICLCPR